MLSSSPPILFCHYGNSKYLQYVLRCAVAHNPNKHVILLGDDSNQKVAVDAGVVHLPYRDFEFGEDLERFETIFQEIKGPKSKASKFWLNFVFKRWFLVANLIDQENIRKFWHFDSDNMLLEPLSQHEHHFQSLDCTEQCGGSCMNGFVNRSSIVRSFVQKINALFEDEEFLASQRQQVLENQDPRTHFNEMVAYTQFKVDHEINSERLFQVRNNAIFDDAICHCEQFEAETLPTGGSLKRLMISEDGKFYGFIENQPNRQPIRFVTLNLSWVPLYVYRNVYQHSLNRLDQELDTQIDEGDSAGPLSPFRNLPIPFGEFWKYKLRLATRSIRYPWKTLRKKLSG